LTTSGAQAPGLREVRENLLGYRFEGVTRLSGIAPERLRALEADQAVLTVYESEALAQLYGLDADQLVERPIRIEDGDGVVTLASMQEFQDVSDTARASIVAAANAARDLRSLGTRLGEPDPRRAFQSVLKTVRFDRGRSAPHRQGAALAGALRKTLGLRSDPIASVRDLVSDHFPMVSVLHANLHDEQLAGLTFADAFRGPAIVLNLAGKNRNALVRRFSLLHELCHLLFDWVTGAPLATLSGYLSERRLDAERRANSFAVRFLCPEKIVKGFTEGEDPVSAAHFLIKQFGLPYAAARLYLKNESKLTELPPAVPPKLMIADASWVAAEKPAGLDEFPVPAAPAERRTLVAARAAALYAKGEIQRDVFARLLGVAPTEPVEDVLSFLGLDPPDSAAMA
jgi:hypothetical protein